MKVYLVYGDVYFRQYGSEFHLFGVFTSKEMAEKVKKQEEDKFFQQEMKKNRVTATLTAGKKLNSK